MEETPPTNIAAMLGLIFGILAWFMRFMGCLASFLGLGLPFQLLGMVFDVVGVATGIVGIVVARRQEGNGLAMGIVGTALSAVDLVITALLCAATFAMVFAFFMFYVALIVAVILGDQH